MRTQAPPLSHGRPELSGLAESALLEQKWRGVLYTWNEVWPLNMEDNTLEALAIGSCGLGGPGANTLSARTWSVLGFALKIVRARRGREEWTRDTGLITCRSWGIFPPHNSDLSKVTPSLPLHTHTLTFFHFSISCLCFSICEETNHCSQL